MPGFRASRWAISWLCLPLLSLLGCSDPIALSWKAELGAGSLSTPLVTADFIAVGTDRGLVILEKSGQLRCRLDTGEVKSSPSTDGERVYFGSTNYLFYAVTPQCKEVWKFATRDRIKSDPLVADGRVYTSSYDGYLYALDAATGKKIWSFPELEADPEVSAELAALAQVEAPDGRGSRRAPVRAKGKSKAVQADLSPPEPAEELRKPPTKVGDFSYSSPALYQGIIYAGNLDQYLYAVEAATGRLLWRFKTRAAVTSSPLIEHNTVYFGSNDGHVYALSPDGKHLRWKTRTRDWVNSSPRIVDGVLYIGSNDRHLYAIDASTGAVLWKHSTEGPVISRPVVYENLVFASGASGDGHIYAVEREDGELFWRFKTGGKVESHPVMEGDLLYVSSADQHLYAFQVKRTTPK